MASKEERILKKLEETRKRVIPKRVETGRWWNFKEQPENVDRDLKAYRVARDVLKRKMPNEEIYIINDRLENLLANPIAFASDAAFIEIKKALADAGYAEEEALKGVLLLKRRRDPEGGHRRELRNVGFTEASAKRKRGGGAGANNPELPEVSGGSGEEDDREVDIDDIIRRYREIRARHEFRRDAPQEVKTEIRRLQEEAKQIIYVVAEELISRKPYDAFYKFFDDVKRDDRVRKLINNNLVYEPEVQDIVLDVWGKHEHPPSQPAGGQVFQKGTGYATGGVRVAGRVGNAMYRGSGLRSLLFGKVPTEHPHYTPLDPEVRSAMNEGRIALTKKAGEIYDKEMKNIEQRVKNTEKEFEDAKKAYEENTKKIDEAIRSEAGEGIGITDMINPKKHPDVSSMMQSVLGATTAKQRNYAPLIARYEHSFRVLEIKEKELERLKDSMEKEEEVLRALFSDAAEKIAEEISIKRRIRDKKQEIADYLKAEASRLAYFYGVQAKSALGKLIGKIGIQLRGIAAGTSTIGDVWNNILSNIWGFIFGPWVLGTGFVILQFFFMIAYSGGLAGGFNPLFVFVLPLAMGGFLMLLNAENIRMSLDFLTHIVSGTMIGYSAIILMMAIATPAAVNENIMITILVWLFLAVFIGAFQVYAAGGFPPVFAISVVVILFGWLAMGPYGGYYSMVIDQVKAPLVLAWRAIQNAFEDVWLLATNPTEWYARQQMRNVRSEKPLDYPKALEIVSFDTIPSQGIPASKTDMKMEFAATVTLQNKGRMAASGIGVDIQCNTFCSSSAEPVQAIGSMKPGEGNVIQFTKLSSWIPTPGREAEFHAAKVTVNISYRYSTNASLTATVTNEEEIKKQFAEGKDVFKPVQAIDMGTPATLSLNVGPQPLFRGKNSLLLVSVYTIRDDGYVVLDRDTRIRLRLPSSIGGKLECSACSESAYSIPDKDNNVIESGEEALCSPPERVEIKPFEFSTTYSFLCNFEANSDVQVSKTGVIRAEMPNYEFVVLKSKDIGITPPLGVLVSDVTKSTAECMIKDATFWSSLVGKVKGIPGVPDFTLDWLENTLDRGAFQSHIDGYKKYSSAIDDAVQSNKLESASGLGSTQARALVAAIISAESEWKPAGIDAGNVAKKLVADYDSLSAYKSDRANQMMLVMAAYKGADIKTAIGVAGSSKWEDIENKGGLSSETKDFVKKALAYYYVWDRCVQKVEGGQMPGTIVMPNDIVKMIFEVAVDKELGMVMAVGAYMESGWDTNAVADTRGGVICNGQNPGGGREYSCGIFQFNVCGGMGSTVPGMSGLTDDAKCDYWKANPRAEAEIIKGSYASAMSEANWKAQSDSNYLRFKPKWYCFIWKKAEGNAADCNDAGTLKKIQSAVDILTAPAQPGTTGIPAAPPQPGTAPVANGPINPVSGATCDPSSYTSSHKAVDIPANCGTEVKAACGGRLSYTMGVFSGGQGAFLEHGANCKDATRDWSGYTTAYALDSTDTRARDVKQGEVIGTVRNYEGKCQLHFLLTERGKPISEGLDASSVCASP